MLLMKRMYLLIMAATMVIASTFLLGCGNDKVVIEDDVFHVEPLPVPEKPMVDVFLDASLSMAGYTTIPAGNVYRELPDELLDVGSSMGDIKFFSFGSSIIPLNGSDYRKFIRPDAYTELENSIKNVIDEAKP